MEETCLIKKRALSSVKSPIKLSLADDSIRNKVKEKPLNLKLKIDSIKDKADSKKQNLNLKRFHNEVSKLKFCPIGSNANISGNYDNYLEVTLSHISQMKDIHFDDALESPSIYEHFPKKILEKIVKSDKKLLLLDLDETLIHADFDEEFLNDKQIKYDATISFVSEEMYSQETKDDTNESSLTTDDSKEYSGEKIVNTVGIFIRPGVKEFLEEVSKYFDVGIFTASAREYADSVINYLDPNNKYIKFRLYRDNCINIGDLLRVKNLNIFKNIPLEKIVLVDNNMYSFAAQLNNGILINSFSYDKTDTELSNVLSYLINFILPAEDVRKINRDFFGFQNIVEEILIKKI